MTLNLPVRYVPTNKSMFGGQGTVHVYSDSFLKREVAIKVLHGSDQAALKTELRCLSEIHSKHVAEVYDLIELDNGATLALVQEYISGPSFDEYLASPSKRPFAHTLWQIAKGVEDIHRSGKIHRDLKPENFRLDSEKILKILDFGLALDQKSPVTVQLRGTRHYAPPELYGIAPVTLTSAADIYAIGVLAWYVANNKAIPSFLWDGRRDITKPVRSIGSLLSGFSLSLISLLDRCVEIQPISRPTANELRHELQREVLRGTHRMHVTHGDKQTILQKGAERVTLRFGDLNATIVYTGTDFIFESCTADVYVNNMPIFTGWKVPGSCVVTIGSSNRRMFIAIDVSHPGIAS